MRLIDADGLNEDLIHANIGRKSLEEFLKVLKNAPTIEAQPVVHGEWLIKDDENCFATWDCCSVCGFEMGFAHTSHYANFCPNCGAKMKAV